MTKNEIMCPNCGTPIKIDENTYDSIVNQVRDAEFEKEISKREELMAKEKQDAIKLAQAQTESSMKDKLADKDAKILELDKKYEELRAKANVEFAKKKSEHQDALNEKDKQISDLQNQLNNSESIKELAINEATEGYKQQISELKTELNANNEKFKAYLDKVKAENQVKLSDKDKEVIDLQARIAAKDSEKALAISELASKNKEEVANLTAKINLLNEDYKNKENTIKSSFEMQLKAKQEEVDFYKDFKARQSTKAIGEDLEHYCENQYNRTLRPVFTNACFEKDNDVSKETGSKGDFIFRDYDDEKTEVVSIMIECKNEADTTEHKHKNQDFFKELDKDRTEKNCEYAVLVTMLEQDNDLYNDGILDVSHQYPKMYVVRPQFLIPLITLLRNAAYKSLEYKKQLVIAQNQNLDIAHFEENMNNFRDAFGRNYKLASDKFKKAIEEIDKSIDHLQKIKDSLLSSENNLRLANNKAQDLSIKKLTHNAPSVAEKFEDVNAEEAPPDDE